MLMLRRFLNNSAEIAGGKGVRDSLNELYEPQPYQDYQKLGSRSFIASK